MKFIELFCGIGGFRYGLEQIQKTTDYRWDMSYTLSVSDSEEQRQQYNFRCVWANDIDKYACEVYRKNFGTGELYEGDIRTVDPASIPDHDLIVGGFPCQSFSIAGKRGGFEDTRGTLFFEICRIARAKGTKYLFLENVKGLLNHNQGKTFETIIRTLDELGYDCEWQVLNSYDFGKGERPRLFIFAILRDCKNNVREGQKETFSLLLGCDARARNADTGEQENMRNAERIVRTFARLPYWLDCWDSFYTEKEVLW